MACIQFDSILGLLFVLVLACCWYHGMRIHRLEKRPLVKLIGKINC